MTNISKFINKLKILKKKYFVGNRKKSCKIINYSYKAEIAKGYKHLWILIEYLMAEIKYRLYMQDKNIFQIKFFFCYIIVQPTTIHF